MTPNELNPDHFKTGFKGKETDLHFLQNGTNLKVAITNYGARIVSLLVQDRTGKDVDVVVGFDSLEGYLSSKETYYSAIVGRYANRIALGKFSLDGKEYTVPVNNAPNHLHGGPNGFHNQAWELKTVSGRSIQLLYHSPDGEEGFPGNLSVSVTYSLSKDNELSIEYEATTDAPTVFNITSHPFFNLNGQGSGLITDHMLMIDADRYNAVDESLIPRGIEEVEGTPLDFRTPKKIGQDIDTGGEQLQRGNGYDHNYILNGTGFRHVCTATGDKTGITMEVFTDQPGMQLYSGNYMKSENNVKYGMKDHFREAFCLETQHFPDSPNQPQFPTTRLDPGTVFRSRTVYKFLV